MHYNGVVGRTWILFSALSAGDWRLHKLRSFTTHTHTHIYIYICFFSMIILIFAVYQLFLSYTQILVFLEVEVLWHQIWKFFLVVAAHHQKWWLSWTAVNVLRTRTKNTLSQWLNLKLFGNMGIYIYIDGYKIHLNIGIYIYIYVCVFSGSIGFVRCQVFLK